jgi:GntR family transcriptional regulator
MDVTRSRTGPLETERANSLLRRQVPNSQFTSAAPLYQQIFTRVREKIYLGEYPEGSFLPTEQEISEIFGVSRITAKRALDEISAAGLAVREQGRGTRVCIATQSTSLRGKVGGLIHSLHAKGYSSVQVIEFAYVKATGEVSERLNLKKSEKVQRAVRVWHGDKGPFSLLTTYVPAKLGKSWRRSDLENKPLISLLEKHGVTISRAEDRVTATLAKKDVARQLDVEVGAPLLQITRTLFDQSKHPIELLIGLYPPDRYQYSVTLDP